MSDTYRRQSGPQPASTADLLAHLKSSLGSNSKSPRTYAALAAGKVPAGQARPGKGADQRARNSAFFNRRDSPSPDLLAKVASLLRQSDTTQSSRVPQLISGQSRAATPLSSNRSTPEECFGSDNGHQSSAAGWASEASFTRPASVTPSGKSAARGLGIKRSATTPEPHSAPFSLPSLCQPNTSAGSRPWQTADSREPKPAWRQGHREPGTPAPTQTDPSAVSAAAADAATPPAWSEELLNWMLAEKAELLLEVQRLQRRQAEVQQELDRARARAAGPGLEQEVQRLKAERRVLLEKLQHLAQQDAESSALLERARMENDALTTELERSQEVCKEMLAARRAARDALSEMSAQNARLVSAYVEKKQEAAALREDLRRQQCDAEARIRTLAEELHTTQIQCLTLKEQLCSHIHLPATCHTEQGHHSPSRQSSRTEGLPEPSPACRTSSTLDEEISGVDFASAFASPVRQRAPPAPHQQQNGKENAMWSGNRGAINSSGRGKKPLAQQGHEAGQAPVAAMPAGEPAMATKQGKGDWDKERSELLSLLERLQHQLSANAEQQAATPAKQPANAREASWQGQQQDGVRQPLQAHKIPQDLEQESSPSFAAAFGLQSPSVQQPSPKRNASAQDISSPFPPPNEESSPAMTPLSHSSAASSGPTPRHSHFSVPRYSASCSEPLSRVGMYSEQESRVYSSAGSSRRSTQAATPHSRRSSGINLSKVFEGAASNRANSRASTPGSDASESCAVPEAAYYAAHTSGAARPDSAGLCSEPSSASDDGDAGMSTPHAGMTGSPAAAYQPTPIIPPMATPFAAQPREETCCELGGRMGTAQQCAQQHPSLRQHQQPENSELRPVGINSMEEHPVVEGQGTPEEQRLAAAEERNAVLEAEVQHLRQLQHEAEEQARQDEQRRQIDQHKQAGNAAFQQHRYEQAVLEYAAGLEICSAAKNAAASAVLFCNRAAALHAMGRYLEAVADCFRAEQQDASYARLYHRRADAYCAVGAYDAASQDLAQLVQMGCGREVQARLQEVQHKLKAQYPVNHYAVLGVKSSANLAEIKTAYRALALKFHPDKAGQGLPHAAADAIFKLVTAANATLSDAEKRRAHDLQCLRHKYRRFYSYHF